MPITFTADQRKQITRRQLNIITENAAFTGTQSSLAAEKAKLLAVENSNRVFYDFHDARAKSYENEGRQMDGLIPALYSEGVIDPFSAGDVSSSAKAPGSAAAVFFPFTPPYEFFIPKIINSVNGRTNPTGTDARRELNILSNAVVYDGLTEMIFRLENGITGAASATANTTTNIAAGVITGFVLTVDDTTNFAVNELVYINNGAASGIYKITAIDPGISLTIDSVVHSQVGISSGALVDNTVVAFTNTERENLTSTLYQEILTNITNRISALITEWEGKVDSQITHLTGNNEDRATQVSQNSTALSDVNNTKSIIDTWQALPNTGVGAKYTTTGISPISAEITARQTFIPTRLTQIGVALGSVSQTGNDYSGVATSPYFERYKWLNIRINKSSGSARRFFAADDGQNFLGMLVADNNAVKGEYDAYFLTKAITFIDDTVIVNINSVSGLSVGNTVTVLSETQPEISRAIMEILGTTQLRLDRSIPNSYQVSDLARLFKTL